MLSGIGISGTGAQIEQARLENLSANLANMLTPGFKRDLMTFMQRPVESLDVLHDDELDKLYEYEPLLDLQGGGVQIREMFIDNSQGALDYTGNDFDFALDGEGWFVLEHAASGRVYTRAGNFTVGANGDLVTRDGLARVLGANGKPLNFAQLAAEFGASGKEIRVAVDGSITVHGADGSSVETGRSLAAITLSASDRGKLEKLGHTLLAPRHGEKIKPIRLTGSTEIVQGALELSTSNPTLLMAEMVEVSRAYESNMKLLRMQDQSLSALLQRVATVPNN